MLLKTIAKLITGLFLLLVAVIIFASARQSGPDRHCAMLTSVGSDPGAVSYLREWAAEKLDNDLIRSHLGFAGRMKDESGSVVPLDLDPQKLGIDVKYLGVAFDQSDSSALANSRERGDYYSMTLTSGRATLRVVWDPERYQAATEKLHDRSKFEELSPNVYLSCQ